MNNDFAPFQKFNTSFIIKNIITDSNKTIKIFNYPIPVGQERDLLAIPGVSESDIRASLLKGEILHKIKSGEAEIIFSDIDLLQFNLNQRAFLQSAGVVTGLEIGIDNITPALNDYISSGGSGGITADQHEQLRQAIHFLDEGPGHSFASGAFKEILPDSNPFPSSITWWVDNSKTQKIVEKLISRNSSQFPTIITLNIYNIDGTTIAQTIIDTITYSNNSLESSRIRTII